MHFFKLGRSMQNLHVHGLEVKVKVVEKVVVCNAQYNIFVVLDHPWLREGERYDKRNRIFYYTFC